MAVLGSVASHDPAINKQIRQITVQTFADNFARKLIIFQLKV